MKKWQRPSLRLLSSIPLALLVLDLLALPALPARDDLAKPMAPLLQIGTADQVKLDGLLDEPFWHTTQPIGDLTMVEPDEGAVPSERTEVRVAAGVSALYIGIMCYDSAPDRIVSHTMQRDAELRSEDHIKLVFDTFLNGRTGYIFAVNPNGARYDALIEKEGERENKQWDGIWEAAVHRSSQGWSAEIYIPVKTLRFAQGLDRWGFNVERRIERRGHRGRRPLAGGAGPHDDPDLRIVRHVFDELGLEASDLVGRAGPSAVVHDGDREGRGPGRTGAEDHDDDLCYPAQHRPYRPFGYSPCRNHFHPPRLPVMALEIHS